MVVTICGSGCGEKVKVRVLVNWDAGFRVKRLGKMGGVKRKGALNIFLYLFNLW